MRLILHTFIESNPAGSQQIYPTLDPALFLQPVQRMRLHCSMSIHRKYFAWQSQIPYVFHNNNNIC